MCGCLHFSFPYSAKFADNLSQLLSERGWLENLREKFTQGFDFTGFQFMENRDKMWQESSVEVISGETLQYFLFCMLNFCLYYEYINVGGIMSLYFVSISFRLNERHTPSLLVV